MSPSEVPPLSFRRISTTRIRAPRMTGFPSIQRTWSGRGAAGCTQKGSTAWTSILATTTPVRSGTRTRGAGEAAAAPATTIATTTGNTPALGRATAMTTTRGRSDVVPETTGKRQPSTDAITIPAGPVEIAAIENAIARFTAMTARSGLHLRLACQP